MQYKNIEDLAVILNNSGNYRVTKKYRRPEYYNIGGEDDKLIAVFLDIEATGLSYRHDKLIELGMVKFEYTKDGSIFRLLDDFSGYQDPGKQIPEYITKLTGINDDTVKGQKIEEDAVTGYLQDVDLVIAHNAQFDRTFFEKTFPSVPTKSWGCSMYDIDWSVEGISSHKLEYIAYKYDFFYEGHRAVTDCLVGIHILAQNLPNSQELVLKRLLTGALAIRFKIYATDSPYGSKDLLKSRGYRWSMSQNDKYMAWSIELTEDKVTEEINYLCLNIYGRSSINIPVEIFDAHSRFSFNCKQLLDPLKHQEKLEWFQSLFLRYINTITMNIFVTSNCPKLSAQALDNKRVVKMVLDTAQVLSAAIFINSGIVYDRLYKPTHLKHRCTIWVVESLENWDWLLEHFIELCKEYSLRYNRHHVSENILPYLLKYRTDIKGRSMTVFANCTRSESIKVDFKHMQDTLMQLINNILIQNGVITNYRQNGLTEDLRHGIVTDL